MANAVAPKVAAAADATVAFGARSFASVKSTVYSKLDKAAVQSSIGFAAGFSDGVGATTSLKDTASTFGTPDKVGYWVFIREVRKGNSWFFD